MDSTLHTPKTIYSVRHLPSWMMLACSAGAVNGFAFMTCQQFATHLSGTFTQLGLESYQIELMLDSVAIVLSFILGAFMAIMLLHARSQNCLQPRWATPLLSVSLLLTSIAFFGQMGSFGPFGGTDDPAHAPILLLSLLSFAMGLQNASVAVTTGLAVRTTHLTGPATDLGIHLGTAILSKGESRVSALRGAALRGGKICAFALGAGMSVPLCNSFGYLALLAPSALVGLATWLSFIVCARTGDCQTGVLPTFAPLFRRSQTARFLQKTVVSREA